MAELTEVHPIPGVQNVSITEAQAAAHVMRPANVQNVVSSKGLQEGSVLTAPHFPPLTTYEFDVAGFGTALHAALKSEVVGYTMRLRQNSTTIYTLDWNWAKTPADGGEGWTSDVRMHIASCSKLVTGIAMTKLLNDKGISYDAPIVGHLPNYWAKGPDVANITFRELMTHTSGLNYGVDTSASDYETMKAVIAGGVTHRGQYHYQNLNFGLCRILIATINGNVSPATNFGIPQIPNSNDVFWDAVTINAYVQYVQQHVFQPAGVSGPSLDHPTPDALAYTFPAIGQGWNSGDLTSVCGGAGWHMSVDDLLAIMGTFRRSGSIMPAAQAQTMLGDGFGIDLLLSTPLGELYNKNGLWEDGAGHVEQSLAYFLPENMELVVLTNSPVGSPGQFFRDVVTKIYLANIKAEPIILKPLAAQQA
ncbi:MAG TPA: serine hydrolase domain-containing protein [Solirubrobacteraceae bacterium]|nr:serine hydrolase domain-containing protein [Solirubrobacteraceae bacterium]